MVGLMLVKEDEKFQNIHDPFSSTEFSERLLNAANAEKGGL